MAAASGSVTNEDRRDALVERILSSCLGLIDVFAIHIGDRLGFYAALRDAEGLTSGELAAGTRTHERYAREWLEQQAVSGMLEVDAPEAPAAQRRYRLPDGCADVLVDADSPSYFAACARMTVGMVRPLDALLDAYREGGGVPYPDYGEDCREGIAAMNRAMFVNLLGTEWLPAIPDVHRRLLTDTLPRVADIGCGTGWSSIAIARAYPGVRVDGFDVDEASIARARANAEEYGVGERVRFEVRDAADPDLRGAYDVVTVFEAIHDMARPVQALAGVRDLLIPGGAAIVVDERVADAFTAPGDDVERLMYGWSILHCLAVGMAEQPSAATGTVMRTDTLRRYAREAGFSDIEVLPIDNDFWRFYRLI